MADLNAVLRKTSIEQALNIQEHQIVNEEPSNFDASEKPHAMAKQSYQECDILSKKSLERVSPPKLEDKVIITFAHIQCIFFDEAVMFVYYHFTSVYQK